MSNILEDGTGSGSKARVDKSFRLHTRAVSASELLSANLQGESYIVSTGIQNINNDGQNYLLYIKNDSQRDLVISQTNVVSGISTGGADELILLGITNPTGGTLIDSGNNLEPFNLNVGSPNVFNGEVILAGSLGLTASGGIEANALIHGAGRHELKNTFILPKGSSIVTGIKASTGNTSINVSIGYTVYFRTEESK